MLCAHATGLNVTCVLLVTAVLYAPSCGSVVLHLCISIPVKHAQLSYI